MSDDLIKRAREAAEPWDYGEPDTLITELADRIEAQAAEIERLREALEEWVFLYAWRADGMNTEQARIKAKAFISEEYARAALGETK
jgi:hypothetical protein